MNGTIALHCVGGGITETPPVATLVVYKDEAGYGMKVSGDNPVYVQSVKEGGAAARAGLSPGDKIIKVNGVNVTQSTHTQVVELIKSSVQVVLTVQQKSHNMSSGFSSSQHHRPTSLSTNSNTIPSSAVTLQHRVSTGPTCTERITGPQPVDLEKRRQLDAERVKTLQLMLEVEQSNVDKLRSELAKLASQANSGNANNIVAKQAELSTAERRLKKLQEPLDRQLCAMVSSHNSSLSSGGGSCCDSETPPPLPSRKSLSTLSQSPPPLPPRPSPNNSLSSSINSSHMVFDQGRSYLTTATGSHNFFTQAATSSPLSGKHQRAKSSPEQLGNVSPAEASRRLIASESMGELAVGQSRTPTSPLTHQHSVGHHQQQHHYHHQQHQHYHHRHSGIDLDDPCCGGSGFRTPPGTPPPPYPAPILADVSSSTLNEGITDNFTMTSSSRSMQSSLDASTPGLGMIQQPIMSMEDDDMSDQEVGQLEDHGPFKSLSKLWKHHAHLAVFMNYVLSNWDPSSLLFYLITDQYKEGNAKEMRKWAYEIHSSFLVPGAPLRLNNVDENVAREIDDVLLKESDKEEILRKIFWKARVRAKEELNEQLADFQLKRTAGLGMLFGPKDALLDESSTDKRKEIEIIEKFLVPKMDTYSEDIEKENIDQNVDQRKFITACSLATVLTKVFNVRPGSVDRVPTFVAKDKSNIKARLSNAKARKMALKGHHFVAHQYFTVTYCNHCQFIIGGIGPQGYQCGNCQLNVHRQCVRIVDESCPGPLVRKEKGNDRISKLMERIRPEKKPPSHHQNQMHHNDRSKRGEDELSPLGDGENGDHRGIGSASGCTGAAATSSATGSGSRSSIGGCGIGVIGSGAGCGAASANELRRISGFDHADSMDDPSSREDISEMVQQNISSKPKTSNINRSESYKERIHNKRHLREKRKTSDPNLSKTNDCDGSGAFPGNSAGSSSNSSLSTRSLDSPSMSLEQVHPSASASWDSDVDVEADPPDWSQSVTEEVLASLSNTEKKRQEVINELFHTERSHVRALKVLSQVFHRPLLEAQVLPADQLQLLFSNLDEMVQLHSQFNQAMKRKRKENPCVGDIGDLLLDMFDGEAGEVFERAASTFCSKQQVALNALREQRRKDPKLNTILNDIEANPLCRRLQLKDHILTGMLRLTKYPLLFDNLAKYTAEQNEKERTAVLRCLARSREILRSVNQKVKESEDHHRLAEIQRMIDRSAFDKVEHPCVQEFKNLDITKRRLIHEGVLLWRTVTKKPVELHVVLMDDTILLLHKSDDDRLALKFISHMNSVLSPIVRVSTALVRHNAVDKNSLYLVNTSQNGAQIYELVAPSQEERKLWYKHINEAAEALKEKNDKRMTTSSSSNDLGESAEDNLLPETPFKENSNNEANHANKKESEPEKRKETSTVEPVKTNDSNLQQSSSESVDSASVVSPESTTTTENKSAAPVAEDHKKQQTESEDSNLHQPSGVESLRLVTCTQCSLIDPVEVHVEERPVHVAEPVLTPIESLRRIDETVKKALVDKQNIISNILHGSKRNEAEHADDSIKKDAVLTEPQELIVSAIEQTNRLVTMMNSALTLSETETVLASQSSSNAGINAAASCEATGCPTPRLHSRTNLEPSISVSKIQPICTTIASQLVQLLEIIKDRDEERERLRKELRRSRERLHAIDAEVQRRETTDEFNVTSELSLKNEQNTSAEITDQIVKNDCSDGPNQDTSVDTEIVTVPSQQPAVVTTTEPTDNPKQSLALTDSKEAIDSNVSGPV
ncbi:rho guanine nucleotide exchange factor 11 isoform X1 [Trichogramma pretiosum]|uniref:rho guanine nucleotide exchange factor 11 isoform X1 n=1 Tax=Trichogramma pretiosum TaxID=7493 RepID=UPI0006C942A0|nr:rho guanine nucleotide exchange factor 11 isoform X1 [Trichogramma pretiosum]XP_014236834.1 rho guanine nucleotide exchange factor 11 isoform X1 [Trichogramma pretiosum]XP_023318989.1 rho guanine nucleotide exchange factor 11 isoform X1 [Trichogramma pretiosum]